MENKKTIGASFLKEYGFRYKKKLGQNFIFDTALLQRIVRAGAIKPGDQVVEIGPGAGTLTRELALAGASVLAVEIDRTLLPILEDVLGGLDVQIIWGDILKLDLKALLEEKGFQGPYKIVANLPYYITSPLIMHFLEGQYLFDLLVIMVQQEVARRFVALPGAKDYGAITLAVQFFTEPQIAFTVPGRVFIPSPAVDSALMVLRRREKPPVLVRDKKLMFRLIKGAFGQRRKTLLNALAAVDYRPLEKRTIGEILQGAGISGDRRGETLSLEDYARVANLWMERLEGEDSGQSG